MHFANVEFCKRFLWKQKTAPSIWDGAVLLLKKCFFSSIGDDVTFIQNACLDLNEVRNRNAAVLAGVCRLGIDPRQRTLLQDVRLDSKHIRDGDFAVAVDITGDCLSL